MSEHVPDNPRRDFLRKTLTLIPVVTVASTGLGLGASAVIAEPARSPNVPEKTDAAQYQPAFFTVDEYAFLQAAVSRLIPADALGAGALEAGAAEYIDRQMGTPYASGALWYMQGPFNADAAPELGYQLQLNPQQIYRLGIAGVLGWCRAQGNKPFHEQSAAQQDRVLAALEAGDLVLQDVPAKAFFSLLLQNTREGFFCDPVHGGNKGMVGWKQIGFPGARADFMDWAERNERYPFPPVSIRGERA
ncbi:gluconate 2-dehydrogenase subunit 3 family protein [Pseudomonas sp. S32]|uniref:gluconate 2-dehydrogenase subunit 3 family protein n=1 Tax=Pseudomonas sp. S32 TaxID=2767448 RepID=UPI0019137D16|nr:gluconate 2-dehydrogenase subunit 3 family protein [Pseudomonas sp. S32]MBK5004255.1 gluconate 2-dehydrogenase subunit 3 family protein [Pseudomonas sp. S32]